MIYKLWSAVFRIFNWMRIPKLPRGLLSSHYDESELTRDERRVLARFGARDPRGIKYAMKRAGYTDLESFIKDLQIYEAKRDAMHRADLIVGRLVGGVSKIPHQEEIIQSTKKVKPQQEEIQNRLKNLEKEFSNGE